MLDRYVSRNPQFDKTFETMYNEGIPFSKICKQLHISKGTALNTRDRLKLPLRYTQTEWFKIEEKAADVLRSWGFEIIARGSKLTVYDYRARIANQVFAIDVQKGWNNNQFPAKRLEQFGIPAIMVFERGGWSLYVRFAFTEVI